MTTDRIDLSSLDEITRRYRTLLDNIGKPNEVSPKHKIIIHICGGICHIVENPDDVEIEIIDFDMFDYDKDRDKDRDTMS